MPKNNVGMETLQRELEAALTLIRGRSSEAAGNLPSLSGIEALANTDSLLERCAAVVSRQGAAEKPKIRVIRHMACSGGTLVSKCMAAMPNVYLLSELHPASTLHMGSGKAKFLPTDVATQARYARIPEVQELSDQIFLNSVQIAQQHTGKLGGNVVIRAHSHSDYCVGAQVSRECAVTSLLAKHFDVKAIATTRHPLDAYMSLLKNDWIHFQPKTFDEYCRRVIAFIEDQDVVFSYEKFVLNPLEQMQAMTESLRIAYDDSFIDTFGAFNVTGDSGRSGDVIAARARQNIPETLAKEVEKSEAYPRLLSLMKTMKLMDS